MVAKREDAGGTKIGGRSGTSPMLQMGSFYLVGLPLIIMIGLSLFMSVEKWVVEKSSLMIS